MSDRTYTLIEVEKQRAHLEENISQLRASLQHWRTWDAEYEAIKEEVGTVPEDASMAGLESVRDAFDGTLVDSKEMHEIFGKVQLKSRDRIINTLDRRLDYVGRNVETLQKQLGRLESELRTALIDRDSNHEDEEELPIKDIVEELDEEGNIVSAHLHSPGQSLPQVEEALKMASVDTPPNPQSAAKQPSSSAAPVAREHSNSRQTTMTTTTNVAAQVPPLKQLPTKKTVTFAEDTKSSEHSAPRISRGASRVEAILESAKQQEHISKQPPAIVADESPEDAALRLEMIKYGLEGTGEVGAVVAELRLEEGSSDEEWDSSDEDVDEEYDGKGPYERCTGRIVTEDYAQRMLELEQKLGIKSRFTEAAIIESQDESGSGSGSDDERIGRISVNRAAPLSSSHKPSLTTPKVKNDGPKANTGKSVHFAHNLDVSPQGTSAFVTGNGRALEQRDQIDPLSDVVERKAPACAVMQPTASRKSSRFKVARKGNGTGELKGPHDAPLHLLDDQWQEEFGRPQVQGKAIADRLVEKEAAPRNVSFEDDFDNLTMRQEVVDEHHRLRNRFIQRQGGFLKEDESPIQPLDDADGRQERVSRFKAARLSQQ